MSVRSFAPGKEITSPRGMWSAVAQKRKGSPERASFMQNARVAPGVVGSRPGTSVVPSAIATGLVTGLFNWVAPSGNNYVVYRDGTTIKAFLQQTATVSTVIPDIGTTLRPSFADFDVWLYIAGYDKTGNAPLQCHIYDGTNVDVAFRGPVILNSASASDGGAGQCTLGKHYIGFVYLNRSGFLGKPTTTLAGAAISVTLSTDSRLISVSVSIPPQLDGGGTAALSLIMTRADNPNIWYFMPTDPATGAIGSRAVPLNTASTLNFVANLSDADMADSLAGDTATENFLLLTQDAAGNGPFKPSFIAPYGQRMCYGVGANLYISNIGDPQHLTGDQHVVSTPNRRPIAYAFPLPGSTDLYLTGDRWTSRITDNGDVPATWAEPASTSDAIGAPFAGCVCYRTRGNYVWIVTEAGVYVFSGSYAERPVTYLCSDQWARVNWLAAYAIETADDVVGLRLYVAVPLDGATSPTHIFCIDYTSGLDFSAVDISLDILAQPFASVAAVKDLRLSSSTTTSPASASTNLFINATGLVVNAYNNQAGRGDYFNEASGTSEGQFLLLLGLIEAYAATGDLIALTVANNMLAALTVLYRSAGASLVIPNPVTATNIFAPHWLFAVKHSFTSASIHYAQAASFVNGVAVIPDATLGIRYVFQVASVGYTLIYQSPYSPLASGTSYPMASYSYDATAQATTIRLQNTSVTSTLSVVCSSLDGPTIEMDEPYEAFPDWRPLATGEIDAACDTFNWAYRSFLRAYQVLNNPTWHQASIATSQQATIAFNINDSRDWLKPNYQLQPFAQSGSFSFNSMTPAAIYDSDAQGNVTMTVPAGVTSGECQFGIASINDIYRAGDSTQVTVGSLIAQTITVAIDPTSTFVPANRYSATLTLSGSGLQTFTLTAADFKNPANQAIPAGTTVYTFLFDDKATAAHTVTMARVRQYPNRSIQYYGGAVPFTANFLGQPATLISWQGPVYMGYQSPWFYKQMGNEAGVAINLGMLTDAQAAWTAQSALHDTGPFAPVFIFDRSDAVQYGPVNTFGWNGPDPNTKWAGYQYRPLAELAELVFACNGTESYYTQALNAANAFLTFLDAKWTTATAGPPTDYPQTGAETNYPEPHFAAVILRTVLKLDLALRPNGNATGAMNGTYASLLNKVVAMYSALYVSSGPMAGTFCTDLANESWFGFWHGEILRALSLLYQWSASANIGQNAIASQSLTWISGMISFVKPTTVPVVQDFPNITNLWIGPAAAGAIARSDNTTKNDQGVAINSFWESGLIRGVNDFVSRMVRVAALDVWIRGAGILQTTVFGPDRKQSVTPQLLTASGVPSALAEVPGTMYQEKLDLAHIENFTVRIGTSAVDAWWELSEVIAYTKADLYNR